MPSPAKHKSRSTGKVYLLGQDDPLFMPGKLVRMVLELRRLGGAELNVKRARNKLAAGVTAGRLRHALGHNFIVTTEGCEVFARARLRGEQVQEPAAIDRRMWMTREKAAAVLDIEVKTFQDFYVHSGRVDTVTDTRGTVWCSRYDVHAVNTNMPFRKRAALAHQGRLRQQAAALEEMRRQ